MNKKIEIENLDIPLTDVDCWERYPKYRWVYELTRLLDSQNIKWSPFKTPELTHVMQNMSMHTCTTDSIDLGKIYVKKAEGLHLLTETYIVKGEIKYIRHVGNNAPVDINGDVDLLLNAFVTLHFSKFTGVITTETYKNEIYRIQLKPYSDLGISTDNSVSKLLKRIYKRTDSLLSGLTDQVFHESLAS